MTADVQHEGGAMTAKQLSLTAMLVALGSGMSGVPAAAQERREASRPLDVYTSLKSAVARAVAEEPAQPARPAAKVSNQSAASGKGSGGHTGMIISLVGAAAGIGATVYMVNKMQKETKSLPTPY
jgi:uncharacterized protein HemX